ncbi:MAG: hypothetical protein K9K38_10285 [Rhodoferax sp.]|nr:hypothetical protein [Rhodoferax sp.]
MHHFAARKPLKPWLPYLWDALGVTGLIVVLTLFSIWQEAQRHRERAIVFTRNISHKEA